MYSFSAGCPVGQRAYLSKIFVYNIIVNVADNNKVGNWSLISPGRFDHSLATINSLLNSSAIFSKGGGRFDLWSSIIRFSMCPACYLIEDKWFNISIWSISMFDLWSLILKSFQDSTARLPHRRRESHFCCRRGWSLNFPWKMLPPVLLSTEFV